MVKNHPFSTNYSSSPVCLRNSSVLNSSFGANSSFNSSFVEKENLTSNTISRLIKKEYDQICNALRFHPPKPLQYQTSLNELISLHDRTKDECETNAQNLVVSVFLKLCANVLSSLQKPSFEMTLYRLSQLIASTIDDSDSIIKKWADRIVLESSIHLSKTPNFEIDINFNTPSIVDDLELSNGKLQFVRTSIFESARELAESIDLKQTIAIDARLNKDFFEEEGFLQLVLWYFKNDTRALNDSFLTQIFPSLPVVFDVENKLNAHLSLLDVKLYLVSMFIVSSTTTENGMTARIEPATASQLTITNVERDCWKSIVQFSNGIKLSASSRLRLNQLLNSVRLIEGGSEDVRVLFEAWKHCLQQSASQDENVFKTIKEVAEVYRHKMNSLLAYGPLYSSNSSAFVSMSSDRRNDVKALFPLQLDYQFVDTIEAGHIGVVINSTEGYIKIENGSGDNVLDVEENDEVEQLTNENSFATASENSFNDNSQFFSPLKNNRHSVMPDNLRKLVEDDANRSIISTKSVIMAPNKESDETETLDLDSSFSQSVFGNLNKSPVKKIQSGGDSFIKHSYFEDKTLNIIEDEEEEEDHLEAALLESTRRHEESLRKSESSPLKQLNRSPTKDAQTETEDEYVSPVKAKVEICSEEKIEKVEVKKETEEEGVVEEEIDDGGLLDQLLEASTKMIRDLALQRVGISETQEDVTTGTEEEVIKKAGDKLENLNADLDDLIKKFRDGMKTTPSEEGKHDASKCLGCQTDEKQESALRALEKLAHLWDQEGRD